MTAPRLPQVIDPAVFLFGHYRCDRDRSAWVVHQSGADEIELRGCFTAPELRRFAAVLEGNPA